MQNTVRIFNAAKEKYCITYKDRPMKITEGFSIEI
jgi:hypothetical protein